MRLVLTLLTAFLLTACVPQPMYKWGGYDQALLSAYKDPNKVEELRIRLETHITALEASQNKVPPGLYAEVGTLYYQKGDESKARLYYTKERDTWPESSGLMNAMLQNMDRRDQARKEDVK